MCIICRKENLEGLTKIDCSNCPNLTRLVPEGRKLPESLQILYYHICPKLTGPGRRPGDKVNGVAASQTGGQLPEGLQKLYCSFCFNLTRLPKLPEGLRRLWCSNCPKLTRLPELPKNLQLLYCSDCRMLLSYPKKFYPNKPPEGCPFLIPENRKLCLKIKKFLG